MKHSFSEAIKKLEEPEPVAVVARLKEISKEQIELISKLNELIPLEQDLVWGEDAAGNVRPWRLENGDHNTED